MAPAAGPSVGAVRGEARGADGNTREHGRAKYVVEKCRCTVCRKASADYNRWRLRQNAYGRPAYVDAEPARAHVRTLQAQGMGWKRVAAKAGVNQSVVSKLLYGTPTRNMGPSKRIRPATAAAILAVTCDLDALGAATLVDATGTRRRLQALVTIGWSMSQLGARLGARPTNFPAVLQRPFVTAATARAVRALYDELWRTPPPETNKWERIAAARSRNYAAARGWKPPLWWDEDEIDAPVIPDRIGPADDLDEIALERAMKGEPVRLTRAERDEAVRRLLAQGHHKTEIARRLHLSGASVTAVLGGIERAA